MTTIEGNELIALYMGYIFKEGGRWTLHEHSSGEYDDMWVVDECWWYRGNALEDGLIFDRSWDALMPVVRKIQSTSPGLTPNASKDEKFAYGIFGLSIVCPIETVYLYVTNYINWYNTQNS